MALGEQGKGKDFIWLYHHHETEKWKCLFFRISVYAIGRDLSFVLDSYVTFGYGKDPAQYEMEASSAYAPPGSKLTLVTSATTSRSDGTSSQRSHGTNTGVSVAYGETNSEGRTIGSSQSGSYSLNWNY